MKRVVIVGGGFGGLSAARALARAPVEVVLLDRHNHHVFQPLLYQVATAGLSPSDIASPIRHVLRGQRNVRVLLATVAAVDVPEKRVLLEDGERGAVAFAYDALILAAGAAHSYFGHEEWSELAPGLKTLRDALEIRRRVLVAFERAERSDDPREQERLLTFVIVGGGPTGVELAGALAEIARHTLRREYRRIAPERARVVLVEGADGLLLAFPPNLRAKAERSLKRLGVEVRLGRPVGRIERGRVQVGDDVLEAETVLWAAGVAASPLGSTLGVPLDRAGRVRVRPDLTIPGRDDVYVVGDLAALEQDGRWLPGVAQVAMQQAACAARNVLRTLAGRPRVDFRYRNYGNLAAIGRASAVADLGRMRLSGYPAWLFWLFVHLMQLTGFRNRVLVLVQWAFAYFTHQRGARLIGEDLERGPGA